VNRYATHVSNAVIRLKNPSKSVACSAAQGISTFTVEWRDLFSAAFLDEKLRGDPLVPLHQK
jgi:hypothetical protein